jgi:hypothetical protein
VSGGIGKLTAVKVRQARRRGYYGDGGGLFLQVSTKGAKSWVFRFKLGTRLRVMGLGPLQTVSLAEARDRARECRKLRLAGVDPIEARRTERTEAKLESAKATTLPLSAFLWDEIVRLIRRPTSDPADITAFIQSTLHRQEQTPIPPEAQLYLARLLAGEIKQSKGRPTSTLERRTIVASDFVERVERLVGECGTQRSAFEKIAREDRLLVESIERKYRKAIEELRAWPDFAASHPPKRVDKK